MKNLKLFLIILSIFGLSISVQASDWDMPSWQSEIEIKPNGDVIVTETIKADFTNSPHRGIFRDLQTNYLDRLGNNYNIREEILSVKKPNGEDYNYKLIDYAQGIRIRIGDVDKYLSELMTYVIKYKLNRVINHFDEAGYDEFYFNVTGNNGEVNINQVSGKVILPAEIPRNDLKLACYTGFYGSSEQNCEINQIELNTITFSSKKILPPGQGISIVIGFPQNLITKTSFIQELTWFFTDNYGYLIPIVTLITMTGMWIKVGRDEKTSKTTIMPEYEPPAELSPGEIGAIIDEKVDSRDIIASIISIAAKGYMTIQEKVVDNGFWGKTSEFTFIKNKEISDQNLSPHERILYDGIFKSEERVKLEDLKYTFYRHIEKSKNQIYSSLTSKGYFKKNPLDTRETYLGLGGVIAFISIWLIGLGNLSIFIGLLISGLIILAFGNFMPARTKKGFEARMKILGLEEFIRTAEKDRIKFQEHQNIFEKILPYAIALNLADKWAKNCADIIHDTPTWYRTNNPNFANSFSPSIFANSLNIFSSNANSNLTATPRSTSASSGSSGFSSGGGFSGGGFGGGGSGGW